MLRNSRTHARRPWLALLAASLVGALGAGCGGGGGSGSGDTLPGVVLVNFAQAGEDNVPLNRVLEFVFSAPLDPASVGPASIQIRQGPTFGASVFGKYIVEGNTVRFEPALPGLCDLSDSGFQPNTNYRVTVIGSPEEFAIRSLTGAPLQGTTSSTFHTRLDTSPELFEDQIPALPPSVIATTPIDGAHPTSLVPGAAASVQVHQGNTITIDFSENLDPCSVTLNTVLVQQYATGAAGTMPNGFFPEIDQTPSDPFTWGSGNNTTPPARIRANFSLSQDFLSTRLTITPTFGEFPDNALVVVQVTNAVRDFGGLPLVPRTFAFVTENRTSQTLSKTFEFDGDVPILQNQSTAEVNTARAASKVQGFLLFAGDSDNGPTSTILLPAGPDNSRGPLGCVSASVQVNDGTPDDFDPATSVNFDTGATINTCQNSTDGSTAVIYEFRSFRIRNGVTVRVVGRNPAIFLVTGDVRIEAGGVMRARGDGLGGSPQGNGANGVGGGAATPPNTAGGIGVAGGGAGGRCLTTSVAAFSENGTAGFGSPDYNLAPGLAGAANPIRIGAGRGAGSALLNGTNAPNLTSPSGGGGGHAQAAGFDNNGKGQGTGTTPRDFDFPADPDGKGGRGGGTYGHPTGRMLTAESGSGGGGAGYARSTPFTTSSFAQSAGGGGGAGGGFVDFTSSGNIQIFGELDATGGMGGAGSGGFLGGSGGGGGGSGGGLRLLTPGMVDFGTTTLVRASGGLGGNGGLANQAGTAVPNPGGPGGTGRLVVEDGDSIIGGFGGATVQPADGAAGFYRGVFDASRFQGGGLRPIAVTDIIDMGPSNPTYNLPTQNYGIAEDFIAGIPPISSRGIGQTGIYIEARGYSANADGTVNLATVTGWTNVGHFTDSGSEAFPTWVPNVRPPVGDVPVLLLPQGSTTNGFSGVNGRPFLQFRFSFYLGSTMGPFDPGPYIDRWTLRYSYDQ